MVRGRVWPGLYIITAAILWSTIGVASVFSGNPILLSLFRSVSASIVALLIRRSLSKSSIITGLALGVLFAVYPMAAVMAGVGLAAFLLYTAPLWTTFVALALGEKPGAKDALGVSLVLIAIVLIGVQAITGIINLAGLIMGLLSGISYGTYIALARYYARGGSEVDVSWGAIPYTLIITVPAALLYMLTVRTLGLPIRPVLWGVYVGIVATVIPYRLFAMGVSKIKASAASVIATAEPVLAALWGFLFFKQVPSILSLIAYVLIITATVIVSL